MPLGSATSTCAPALKAGSKDGGETPKIARALASDGMFIVVVTVDKQTGKVVTRPEIVTRGFVHGNEQDPLMEGAVDRIMAAVESPGDRTSEVGLLKSQIKDEVSRYLYEQTRRRPLVFPVVVEV